MKADGDRRAEFAHVEFNEKNYGSRNPRFAHVTGNLHHNRLANHAGLRIFAAEIISKPLRTRQYGWNAAAGGRQIDRQTDRQAGGRQTDDLIDR